MIGVTDQKSMFDSVPPSVEQTPCIPVEKVKYIQQFIRPSQEEPTKEKKKEEKKEKKESFGMKFRVNLIHEKVVQDKVQLAEKRTVKMKR